MSTASASRLEKVTVSEKSEGVGSLESLLVLGLELGNKVVELGDDLAVDVEDLFERGC